MRTGRRGRRRFLLAALACFAPLAHAELEVLPLRHRTVDQVLPTLQAFVEPGGAIQGMSGQIIVRASAQNIAEIRRVLASIDTPARRLLISVTQDAATAGRTTGVGVGVRDDGRRVEAVVAGTDRVVAGGERIEQQVQAVEGGPAMIATGIAVPLQATSLGPWGVVSGTTFAQFDTGFAVTPRLAGDRVFLDIAPQRSTLDRGGSANVQRVETTVSGRLGEWIPLGAITRERSAQGATVGTAGGRVASTGGSASGVWVRVEALP